MSCLRLRTVLETGSDFRKMKSRARFSWYRVSGSDFVKAFKSRSRIFKQGSRRLGESRILPFATPYIRNDILTYIWTFMSKDCAMISIRLLPIFLCILVLTKCQDNLIFIPLNFSFHLKIFLIRNFPNISVRMRFDPVRSQLIRG